MAYAMLNGQVVGPVEFFTTANMVKGTLLTGQTVVVLNSPYIFSDSALEFYIDEKYWGLKPDTISTEGGKATITFPSAQTEDIEVAVKILGTKEYQTTEAQAIQALSDRVTEIDSNLTQLEDKTTVYSSEEKIVGTWVDGKPLYRRVYTALNTSISSDTVIDSTFTANDVETLTKFDFNYFFDTYWYGSNVVYDEGGYSFRKDCKLRNNGLTILSNSYGGPITKYSVVLEYTKK